ncbi:MAG: glycosyltransferase family 9 protein [Ignavibacterium sp.]|nr:glycosyltransferase family 9 protein [Ignavibacterium sp.]MDW8374283.1 glycosyltransferase family 9 protein [Ignavibacteriales bacterium]
MKILILALSGIGDALMFSPALKLLRKSNPKAQIDMIVMFKGAKEIYQHNTNLNNLIHFDFLKQGLIKSLKFILSLRRKYDVSINVYPSNRKEYNIINFLIGAEKRFAVKYKRMHFRNLGWLNNNLVDENDETHNVESNVKMVMSLLKERIEEIPKMEIFFSKEDEEFAKKFLIQKIINENHFVIGIHPGCSTLKNHIKRRWEPEKFIQLSKNLISRYDARILIFGGPDEKELKDFILRGINSDNAISIETETLLQSSAIMKRCNLFITNDSALMHIASALQLNVIALIGPTNFHYIHPWKTNHRIVSLNLSCSPCFFYSPKPLRCSRSDIKFKCIKELSVDYVFSEIKSFIKQMEIN